MENIRSFFGKEEELLQQPKAVPEAASEIYEKPQTESPKRIVEKPLPQESGPELPFSPNELRAALHKNQPAEEPTEPEEKEEDISQDLNLFEDALEDMHQEPETRKERPQVDGFFDEFEQFLLREDLDAEGLLEQDILHRMREFHQHQKEGKEYYVYSKDVQAAIQRKLTELKTLEREWFHTKKQIDELERGLTGLEQEIENHSRELQKLMKQARSKSRLEQKVPAGEEFVLPDGRKLASLLDLKIALRTMPDDMFHQHVTQKKNDFAAWVEHTMEDKEQAEKMKSIRDKHQLDVFLSRLAG